MRIFLTWSGSMSGDLARVLRDWLPLVMQEVVPFVSAEDIRKGNRWLREIQDQLDKAQYGIACLTRASLSAPWLLYEAGALSKDLDESVLWTVLFDGLEQADVVGPLRQFQHTSPTHDDIWRLVESVNEKLERSLPENRLRETFDAFWPQLKHRIDEVTNAHRESEAVATRRPERELLEEVLELSRQTAKAWSSSGFVPQHDRFLLREYQTVVVPEPDQDPDLLGAFQQQVVQSHEARVAGLRAHGQMGGEDRAFELTFQVLRPMSKQSLLDIARSIDVQIVDIYYRPLPLRER